MSKPDDGVVIFQEHGPDSLEFFAWKQGLPDGCRVLTGGRVERIQGPHREPFHPDAAWWKEWERDVREPVRWEARCRRCR